VWVLPKTVFSDQTLEGVVVDDQARAAAIIGGKVTTLRTRREQELAGYRAALDYLFGQDLRALNIGLLLHLHRNCHLGAAHLLEAERSVELAAPNRGRRRCEELREGPAVRLLGDESVAELHHEG
jgi:hypothetical protein